MIAWLGLLLAIDPALGHPHAPALRGPRVVDLSALPAPAPEPAARRTFDDLDAFARAQTTVSAPLHGTRTLADGELAVEPAAIFAVEDLPGNAYPRKHTLYLNFLGADLLSGADNSAENRSTLASPGPYPAYTGGEATALAAIQAVQNDVAAYGIRVAYEERPPKTLPYTMTMIGGDWTDTNLETPAGGVAPIADCGALGQRHVVYVFADAGWGAISIANVVSQEAGHGWGLDHNLNCSSVMSYCGGGDGIFSSSCDGLCEEQCQGASGCRLTHEMFCGEGSNAQNEHAELSWIFGGNEPDIEPPTVEIVEPADGTVVTAGSSIDLRAIVDDNYGGFGWRFIIEKDGALEYDRPDYEKDVDPEYRAALNLVNLEAGAYVLTVEVLDHYNDPVRASVSLLVEGVVDDTGPVTGADGSEGGGESDGDDGSVDEASGGQTADADGEPSGGGGGGASGDDDGVGSRGCACSSGDGPGYASMFPMVVALALLRRRTRMDGG